MQHHLIDFSKFASVAIRAADKVHRDPSKPLETSVHDLRMNLNEKTLNRLQPSLDQIWRKLVCFKRFLEVHKSMKTLSRSMIMHESAAPPAATGCGPAHTDRLESAAAEGTPLGQRCKAGFSLMAYTIRLACSLPLMVHCTDTEGSVKSKHIFGWERVLETRKRHEISWSQALSYFR